MPEVSEIVSQLEEILNSRRTVESQQKDIRAHLDGLKNPRLVEDALVFVSNQILEKNLSLGPRLNFIVRTASSKATSSAPVKRAVPRESFHQWIGADRVRPTGNQFIPNENGAIIEEHERPLTPTLENYHKPALESTTDSCPAPPSLGRTAEDVPPTPPSSSPSSSSTAPPTIPARSAYTDAPAESTTTTAADAKVLGSSDLQLLTGRLKEVAALGVVEMPEDGKPTSAMSLLRTISGLCQNKDMCVTAVACGLLDPLITVIGLEGQESLVVYHGLLILCFMGSHPDVSIVKHLGASEDCVSTIVKLLASKTHRYNASILLSYIANKDRGGGAPMALQVNALPAILGMITTVLAEALTYNMQGEGGEEQSTKFKNGTPTDREVLLCNGIRALYHTIADNPSSLQALVALPNATATLVELLEREVSPTPGSSLSERSAAEVTFNTLVIFTRVLQSAACEEALSSCSILSVLVKMGRKGGALPKDQLRLVINCMNTLSCKVPWGVDAFIEAGGLTVYAELLATYGSDPDFMQSNVKLFVGLNNFTLHPAHAHAFVEIGGLEPLLAMATDTMCMPVWEASAGALINFTQTEEMQLRFANDQVMGTLLDGLGSEEALSVSVTAPIFAKGRRGLTEALGNILLSKPAVDPFLENGGLNRALALINAAVGDIPQRESDPALLASTMRLACIVGQEEAGRDMLMARDAVQLAMKLLTFAKSMIVPKKAVASGAVKKPTARKRRSSIMVALPSASSLDGGSMDANERWRDVVDRTTELLLVMTLARGASSIIAKGSTLKVLVEFLKQDPNPDPDVDIHPHTNVIKLLFNLMQDDEIVQSARLIDDWSSENNCVKQIMRSTQDNEMLRFCMGILSALDAATTSSR